MTPSDPPIAQEADVHDPIGPTVEAFQAARR
jgi:hypothetical protein